MDGGMGVEEGGEGKRREGGRAVKRLCEVLCATRVFGV